ncbi:hypothetical protein PybrP1_010057, partial [[Pythium] brassicae (nom. inval.)]
AFFSVIAIEAVGDIQRGASASLPSSRSAAKKARLSSRDERAPSSTSQGPSPDAEMKFVADTMVTRVGKWMRTTGVDVVLWDPSKLPPASDAKSALLAFAASEQRVVLTRDTKLASRRDAGACFVVAPDDPFQQFQEIKAHFALQLNADEMMSRCVHCNAKALEKVDVAYARSRTKEEFDVPAKVLAYVTDYWLCSSCNRIYWSGPKYNSTYATVARMFDREAPPNTE